MQTTSPLRQRFDAWSARFVLASFSVLMANAAFAQDFPKISPKLQPQMDSASAEFERARNALPQRFTWPTTASAPMPCDGATEQLHRAGGVVRQDDAATKKIYARLERQSNMLPGSIKPPLFQAKNLHIVKAQCKDGKLDGDVEGWLDYDMINDSATVLMQVSYRSHFKARYSSGKDLYESNVVARIQTASKTTYKDPATEKMMSSVKTPAINVATFTADSPSGNVSVMYMTMDGKAKLNTTVVDVESPPPKLKTKMLMYQRAQLISESQMRDSQQHGWMVLHPHTDMMNGFPIPGSKTCFDDGEIIKSNTCDVD